MNKVRKRSIKFGIDVFLKRKLHQKYAHFNCALLTNQAATTVDLIPSYFVLKEVLPKSLRLLFSPQHGLYSEKQANMISSWDEKEPFYDLPVISLYGPRLKPEEDHLREIDVVFIDLPEVGCRVYTYIWTMYLMLSACEKTKTKVLILDRPNPLGGMVEGPILEPEYFSFVGLDALPMRHGLTMGELALLFQKRHFPDLELEVIPCEGYEKRYIYPELGVPWLNPSPNLPDFFSALCYPGMVLLEGTNLSEGRGTTKPFTTFGAPYLNLKKLYFQLQELFPEKEWGIIFRPIIFEPTFDKWKGQRCFGFAIHLKDPAKFKPVAFGLKLLKILSLEYEEFGWLSPPYEFEKETKPIEILIGSSKILTWLFSEDTLEIPPEFTYSIKGYQQEISSLALYEE